MNGRIPVLIRHWGTVALAFLLPWQARWIARPAVTEWRMLSLFATELLVGALVAVSFADRAFQERLRARVPRGAAFAAALLAVLAFASFLWSAEPDLALQKTATLVLAFTAAGLLVGHERPRSLVGAFLASMTLQAVFGVAQATFGASPASKWVGIASHSAKAGAASVVEGADMRLLRAYGTLPHPNVLGGFLALAVLASLAAYAAAAARKARVASLAALAVLLLGLFLTFSRSAWLAAVAGSLPVLWRMFRERAGAHVLLPLALVPTVIAAVIFWPLVVGRATGEGRLEARSVSERVAGIEALLPAVASAPAVAAIGVGVGNWPKPIHVLPLQAFAELGVVGLALLALLWASASRAAQSTPLGLGASIALTVIGLFDHYLWTLWAGNLLAAFGVFLMLRRDETRRTPP